jgi:very-short-patch-repair endonuclease
VTSPLQTVVDCLRDLCLREALSVGDSALRSGMVDDAALIARIAVLRGPGSAKVRSRAAMLDARAANAFESSCRAILIDGGVIGFAPQVSIRHQGRFLGRVDLCHQVLRIVIECESFAHHGDRASLRRDCRRYSSLEAAGWRVLRVSWEDVMFEPDWVLSRVRDTVSAAGGPSFEEQRPSGADARPL